MDVDSVCDGLLLLVSEGAAVRLPEGVTLRVPEGDAVEVGVLDSVLVDVGSRVAAAHRGGVCAQRPAPCPSPHPLETTCHDRVMTLQGKSDALVTARIGGFFLVYSHIRERYFSLQNTFCQKREQAVVR